MRVALNPKQVKHSIVELYNCGKSEVVAMLTENCKGKSLTMVTDFWSLKNKSAKFIGLRVYLVDSAFQFKSVLLGTRHFNPDFCERDMGIRGPFKRWIDEILQDFQIYPDQFFGAMSDSGSDVKWMMNHGYKLQWEWCIPHMTNAATKMAFGISKDFLSSKNPTMSR